MPKIGIVEVQELYALAKDIADGKIGENEAGQHISSKLGMNYSSAMGYLRKPRQLLARERYTRTMNGLATKFFLESILSDYGPEKAQAAISSVRKHLEYYPRGAQPSITAIVDSFAETVVGDITPFHLTFDREVERLMDDPIAVSKGLKENVGGKPTKLVSSVTVFVRSAAVAAAVRLRANGFCEQCKKPAPFKKKTNGHPFLEVHHRIRLADDGPDTTENTIAVCPNCHRELHYG